MAKDDLLARAGKIYSAKTGKNMSKMDMNAMFKAFSQAIIEILAEGGEVAFAVNLGAFRVEERAERKGRNPCTGEEITIPAKKIAKFREGKALKDALNGCGKRERRHD